MSECLPLPSQISHLYAINIEQHSQDSEEFQHIRTALDSLSKMAILSHKPLPAIADFSLCLKGVDVTVSIRHIKSDVFISSEVDLKLLHGFHVMLFRDMLKLLKNFMAYDFSNEENSFLVIPILCNDQDYINWNLVKQFQKLNGESQSTVTRKQYKAADWLGKVVTNGRTNKKFAVVKIEESKTPLSPFPNPLYSSFRNYFESKYNQSAHKLDTFLIEVKSISSSLTFLPRQHGDIQNKKPYTILLIPELCQNFGFPYDLWIQCTFVPSVLYRLHSILIADKLRISIDKFVGLHSNNYRPRNDGFGETTLNKKGK